MKITNKEKLLNIFENTLDDGSMKYSGSFEKIDYYDLMCKSATNSSLHIIENSNVCMFNCLYENMESVLIMVAIPIVVDQSKGKKHIVERTMEIVELLESTFVTIDFMNSEEVKEERFVYLIAVKKL